MDEQNQIYMEARIRLNTAMVDFVQAASRINKDPQAICRDVVDSLHDAGISLDPDKL